MRSSNKRDWSSLPEMAVFDIATRLNPVEFIFFSCVCKSWRSVCKENKSQINALHPPLLLFHRCSYFHGPWFQRTSPVCQLYSFPDSTFYAKPLPSDFYEVDFVYYGVSQDGYLISGPSHGSYLRFSNLFTTDRIDVLTPAKIFPDFVVLTAPPRSGACVVVAFVDEYLSYCNFGGGDDEEPEWCTVRYLDLFKHNHVAIWQALFFKGRLYCLTGNSVFTVALDHCTDSRSQLQLRLEAFAPLNFRSPNRHMNCPTPSSPLCLLANKDELFVLALAPNPWGGNEANEVYRLRDPDKGEWELVDNVGGRTLFATRSNGFLPSSAGLAGWGQGWRDRVSFVAPLCSIPLSGPGADRIFTEEDGHSLGRDFEWIHNIFLSWVSPSLIC